MSTNSFIGMKTSSMTVKYIYCHWDGYLDHHAVILNLFYKDPKKVEKLLNLGDLSALGCTVDIPKQFSDRRYADECHLCSGVHVKTDFSFPYSIGKKSFKNITAKEMLLKEFYPTGGISYVYLFDADKKKWYTMGTDGIKSKAFDLDRIFKDINYLREFFKCRHYNAEWDESHVKGTYEDIQKNLKLYYDEAHNISILDAYNDFLREKKIVDLEFCKVKDKNGKSVYGIAKKLQPNETRRKILYRSASIGEVLKVTLDNRGVSFF